MSEKDVVENIGAIPGKINIPTATNSTIGAASFDEKDFTVTDGKVSSILSRGIPQYLGKIVDSDTDDGYYHWVITSNIDTTKRIKIGEYIMLAESLVNIPAGSIFEITDVLSTDSSYNVATNKVAAMKLNVSIVGDYLANTGDDKIALKNNESIDYSKEATPNTIAQRDSNGRLKAADGVADDDLATVKQLNDSETETDNLIEETRTDLQGKIDLKLDKSVADTRFVKKAQRAAPFLYAGSPDGDTIAYISQTPNEMNVPQYTSNATLKTSAPIANNDCANKHWVEAQIAAAHTSVYTYKGSKDTYANLPAAGNKVGDVWNVEDTGINYAWNGADWDSLSANVLDSTGDSTIQAMSQKATTDELNKKGLVRVFTVPDDGEAQTGMLGDEEYEKLSNPDGHNYYVFDEATGLALKYNQTLSLSTTDILYYTADIVYSRYVKRIYFTVNGLEWMRYENVSNSAKALTEIEGSAQILNYIGIGGLDYIIGGNEVYIGSTTPSGIPKIWIDPSASPSGGGGSSGGGKLYRHKTTLKEDGKTCEIYSLSSVMKPYANASEGVQYIDDGCTVIGKKDDEPDIGWGIMYGSGALWTLSGTTYLIRLSPISFINDISEEV